MCAILLGYLLALSSSFVVSLGLTGRRVTTVGSPPSLAGWLFPLDAWPDVLLHPLYLLLSVDCVTEHRRLYLLLPADIGSLAGLTEITQAVSIVFVPGIALADP